MLYPRLVNTSEAPVFEDTAVLPCFATCKPKVAQTIALIVEILMVLSLSPPVPTISPTSTLVSLSNGSAALIMAEAAPPISSAL